MNIFDFNFCYARESDKIVILKTYIFLEMSDIRLFVFRNSETEGAKGKIAATAIVFYSSFLSDDVRYCKQRNFSILTKEKPRFPNKAYTAHFLFMYM